MIPVIRRLVPLVSFICITLSGSAQQASNEAPKKEPRPYQLLNSGKQFTLKSTKNIKQVMLWTSNGHRVIEQRDINSTSTTFTIPFNDKIYYLMVGMDGGKVYTEKIGIR